MSQNFPGVSRSHLAREIGLLWLLTLAFASPITSTAFRYLSLLRIQRILTGRMGPLNGKKLSVRKCIMLELNSRSWRMMNLHHQVTRNQVAIQYLLLRWISRGNIGGPQMSIKLHTLSPQFMQELYQEKAFVYSSEVMTCMASMSLRRMCVTCTSKLQRPISTMLFVGPNSDY